MRPDWLRSKQIYYFLWKLCNRTKMAVKFKFNHKKNEIVDKSSRVWRAQNYLFWKKTTFKMSSKETKWSNFIKLDQTWSNLIKLDQTWSFSKYLGPSHVTSSWHATNYAKSSVPRPHWQFSSNFRVLWSSLFFVKSWCNHVHDTGCPKTNLMKHPVFPIKQTNKIVKLKSFMMIIISSTNRDAITWYWVFQSKLMKNRPRLNW